MGGDAAAAFGAVPAGDSAVTHPAGEGTPNRRNPCGSARLKSDLPFFGLSTLDWIMPFQSRKAGEVGICGLQDQTPFDGQGGQMGIRGEVAGGSRALQQNRPGLEMRLGGMNQVDVRQAQPLLHASDRIGNGHGAVKNFRMRGDADKPKNHHPRQRHSGMSLEASIPPVKRFLMLRRAEIVGVNEQVNVRENHLGSPFLGSLQLPVHQPIGSGGRSQGRLWVIRNRGEGPRRGVAFQWNYPSVPCAARC